MHWARGPDGTATAAARDGAVFNVFSRRTEDMTAKYPDAVEAAVAAAAPGITSFVLDGEAVAVDGAGQLMPFQHLTTRARCVAPHLALVRQCRCGVRVVSVQVRPNPVPLRAAAAKGAVTRRRKWTCVSTPSTCYSSMACRCWTCVSALAWPLAAACVQGVIDSVTLPPPPFNSGCQLPLRVRRALLEAFFSETESVFQVVPSTTLQRARHASAAPVEAGTTEADDGGAARGDDGDDAYLETQLMACVEEAVNWGAEGLMAKPLEGQAAVYRAGTRTKSWMKLKKDFDGRIGGDTLDLVPIAACVAPSRPSRRLKHG